MVTIGVDPHKSSHTAVAVGEREEVLGSLKVRASTAQIEQLQSWAAPFGARVWAVESAQGLGYLLSQQLVAAGEIVVDVSPVLASRARLLESGRSQKNDTNDARSIAIAALRQQVPRVVRTDDHARVLKLLAKRQRDLSRLRNQATSRLHALLLELVPGGIRRPIQLNRATTMINELRQDNEMIRHRIILAGDLCDDIARYDQQIAAMKRRLGEAVASSGSTLTSIFGIGPVCAALIIGHTGDIFRFPTAGHFASYNATAPIEASSGEHRRHRLNPRGNRQLNYALHIAAVVQVRHPSPGRDYYNRKVAEGKSHKEALRSLKRQISDTVYRRLVIDARAASSS